MNIDIKNRDIEWYKKRYEDILEDIVVCDTNFQALKNQYNNLDKENAFLRDQLEAAKILIDKLWIPGEKS